MKKYFFLILLAVFLLAIFVTNNLLTQPADPKNTTQALFVVQPGDGVGSIATRLEKEGLIRNRFVFRLVVKQQGLESKIQTGDFRLSKSMTPAQIAKELTTGTLDVWVQIIEGWRTEEIAEILKKHVPTYEDSWPRELKKHEGKLFPDTYLIPKNADIALIIRIMTDNFDTKADNLTVSNDFLILASIVEREALFDEDRPVIAGILLNRVKLGMALQADATVQYALGFQEKEKSWWKKELSKDDLATNSPFNTYQFPGLPSKPIANPGLASIKAAIHPAQTDYLYYLHDKKGKTHYAKTLEEHNANIAKYL